MVQAAGGAERCRIVRSVAVYALVVVAVTAASMVKRLPLPECMVERRGVACLQT